MADAFIYDTVRTPRGRGKKDGSLHEITPISLTTQVLQAVRDRSNLDTSLVDDVIWGVVDPVAEQGAVLPRVAALNADYSEDVAGVQVNRFCASGLVATNLAAAKVMSGQSDLVVGGGTECMSLKKPGVRVYWAGWAVSARCSRFPATTNNRYWYPAPMVSAPSCV